MKDKPIIKLYWDLDGVCAKWNPDASIEDTYMPGYFANRECQWNAIMAMYGISQTHPEIETSILSHYYMNGCALADKNTWCDYVHRSCSALAPQARINRIFVPYGTSKYLFIEHKPDSLNILIDDYTKNLLEWENAGYSGIKFLNGINHSKKTWKGAMIMHTDPSDAIIRTVEKHIESLCG